VGAELSDDGIWTSFAYRPNDGEDTLHIRKVDGSLHYTIPLASSASFSPDGQWAAYVINLPKEEREKLQKDRKPVPRKAQLLRLSNGEKWTYENIASLSFSPDSRFLAIKKAKADPNLKHQGTDLILRHLGSGLDQNFGNVSEFAFNERSSHLAFLVDADKMSGNGIYLTDLNTFSVRPLDTDTLSYSGLTWDDQGYEKPLAVQRGTALAALKGHTPAGKVQRENVLLLVKNVQGTQPAIMNYLPDLTDNLVLTERGSLQWSESGRVLYVNVIPQRPEPPKSKEKLSNVEVWHWEDELIQSVQKVRNNALSNASYRAAFHVDKKQMVVLGSDELRTVLAGRHDAFVMGADPRPHISDVNWGVSPADYYRVNVATGTRELVEEKIGRSMGLSPDESKWLYLKEGEVYLYNLATGQKTHLTKNTTVDFVDQEDDHPYELPSYGVAGWTKDGKSVILNHKYDLYLVALDGSGVQNMAGGKGDKEEIRFRYVSLDPEQSYIDLSQPLILSAYGEWTKKSGFFQLEKPGQSPRELVYSDHSYGRPIKAAGANILLYTRETFVDFPDYYVSGIDFKNSTRITHANPQQSEYAWGRRVLVDYTNGKGQRMQGTLTLPAGYQEGKKYPMVVYFYELMSQRHHQYSMPVYDDRPHMSTYASNGYLVFMPDVRYDEGTPGYNALDNVTSAVQQVIDLGYADPERIGLQGHSWGGYQSSFILTQTDLFACVVTGAPVTNLVSMYNILYKRTGTVNHGIFEIGQVRMGRDVTPWTHRDLYVSQSPIEHVDKITTPFMILHGTADGAVDYNQGLELYNAARRMGKEVVLLTYPDEPHHLEMLENQKDFQKRMMQYFNYYLKGEEAAEWLSKGLPFKDRLYHLPLKK
jgi:dipeptidyl aminopeptidase/acylaminoacyl peptidase